MIQGEMMPLKTLLICRAFEAISKGGLGRPIHSLPRSPETQQRT